MSNTHKKKKKLSLINLGADNWLEFVDLNDSDIVELPTTPQFFL